MASRSWTGVEGAGSRDYTPEEARRVVKTVGEYAGREHATSLELFSRRVNLPGRTVRSILSASDGIDFVVCMPSDGRLWIAEYQDEAEHTTRQLYSRANKIRSRAQRRDAYAQRLSRRQGYLFEPDVADSDEDDDS